MPTFSRPLYLSLAMLAVVGFALSGCGRKSDLDVPGAAPVQHKDSKQKPKVEERPFFLDPIL